MKMVIFFFLLRTAWNTDLTNTTCSLINPKSSSDCYAASQENLRCCYLNLNDLAKNTSRCDIVMNNTSTLEIDNYQYHVDCNVSPAKYLDLEQCGGNDPPSSPSDCWLSTISISKRCCWVYMGGQKKCFFVSGSLPSKITYSGLNFDCFSFLAKINALVLLCYIILQ